MTAPIHFYLTFNPFANRYRQAGYTQAHDFYFFLKKMIVSKQSNFAYWGKMDSKNKKYNINHCEINNIIKINDRNGEMTYLFITDFQHLWVANIVEALDSIKDSKHTLDFYQDKEVGVWFKVVDFTLLTNTFSQTASRLYSFYIENDFQPNVVKGISPFNTGLTFPSYIQDRESEVIFNSFHDLIILKENRRIDSKLTNKVIHYLSYYILGPDIYSKIPHAAKIELETAELDVLEKREYSNARNVFSYLKALEIIINDLVIGTLKRSKSCDKFFVKTDLNPPKIFINNPSGQLTNLSQWDKGFSIPQVLFLVRKCMEEKYAPFLDVFSEQLVFLKYISNEFTDLIKKNMLIEIRGIVSHGNTGEILPDDIDIIRRLIFGIGCDGLINKLYEYYDKSEVKVQGKYKRTGFNRKKAS